jgi:hypothetical protein
MAATEPRNDTDSATDPGGQDVYSIEVTDHGHTTHAYHPPSGLKSLGDTTSEAVADLITRVDAYRGGTH